jgi:hypothetical protein
MNEGRAQAAADYSVADRTGSLSPTSTAQRRQSPQHPVVTADATCQQGEADQLRCKLTKLGADVDSKEAELAAALVAMEGAQQPALSIHVKSYGILLCQVMSGATDCFSSAC